MADTIRDGRKRNFFDLENSVIDRNDLDIYQKMVYVVLARHANKETDQCFPGYATIAKKAGISKRKAIDVIRELESIGLIFKETRYSKNGDPDSNCYTVLSTDISKEVPAERLAHEILVPEENLGGSAHGALGKDEEESVQEGSAYHALGSESGARGVVHEVHVGSAHGAPKQYLFNNTNIKSVSQSLNIINNTETDGLIFDQQFLKDFIELHEINESSDTAYSEMIKSAVTYGLSKGLSSKGCRRITPEMFREKLLEFEKIDILFAYSKYSFEKINKERTEPIRQPIPYLAGIIYNARAERIDTHSVS